MGGSPSLKYTTGSGGEPVSFSLQLYSRCEALPAPPCADRPWVERGRVVLSLLWADTMALGPCGFLLLLAVPGE